MSKRRPLFVLVAFTAAVALTASACGSSSTPAAAPASSSSPAGSAPASSTAAGSTAAGSTVASAAAAGSTPAGSTPATSAVVSPAPAASSGQTAASGAAGSAPISSAAASSTVSASGSGSSSTGIAGCDPATLPTKKSGSLTIATDDPAYAPWFAGNAPTSGKGFESAVAYAVAGRLGYDKSKVTWVKESFNAAISPAPKNFDFDINEFTITATRAKAVDFSTGYYDVTQAVVTVKGSKIAGAKTIADLKNARLGAQIGTTSLDALNSTIAPTDKPTVFPTNDKAVEQLKNGQVDGIVVDTPTAFYMASAQLDNGVIVGQLPSGTGTPDQFGLLLDKGSQLTSCASKAVDALRADGTLAKLQTTWLANAGAPVLK